MSEQEWEEVMRDVSYYGIQIAEQQAIEQMLNTWLLLYLKRDSKERSKVLKQIKR